MQGFLDDFKEWAKSPFSVDMSAYHWFLFIGLVLVLLVAWGIILKHIEGIAP